MAKKKVSRPPAKGTGGTKKKKAATPRKSRKKKIADALVPPPPGASEEEVAHYNQILWQNQRLLDKRVEYHEARAEARDLRKELGSMMDELVWMIRRGPDPQKQFRFADPDDELRGDGGDKPAGGTDADDEDRSTPEPAADDWRKWRVDQLGLSRGLATLLCDFGLETLGQLRDFWRDGKVLHEAIKGLGEEKAAKVADAWAKFSKDHPEINE
jgi:hypothetical protein